MPSGAERPPSRWQQMGSAVIASRAFRALAPRIVPSFHRFVARVSGGRTLLDSAGTPMLMLHVAGAKSGKAYDTPLAAVPLDGDRLVVVGSNFARESHPAWTTNLSVNPEAEITFRGARRRIRARLVTDRERAELWPQLLEVFPAWDRYTEITEREFRIFELTPLDPED